MLSALVSVRNTDPVRSVRVVSAKYYDTKGKLLREFVSSPQILGPLATYEILIERKESAGGSGANFLIRWESDAPTNPLVIEGIHAEARGARTLSFVTSGKAIVTGE